jgi:hypothetical protein
MAARTPDEIDRPFQNALNGGDLDTLVPFGVEASAS